ncbi:hypothetical protein SSS_06469 [Sarcoptes scabiei]|nr:hypothetical protein SSS_06469 [Sarcoptes scabiei]
MEIYNKLMENVEKFLHEPGKVDYYMGMLEKSTGIKRMYIAKGKLFQAIIHSIFFSLNIRFLFLLPNQSVLLWSDFDFKISRNGFVSCVYDFRLFRSANL